MKILEAFRGRRTVMPTGTIPPPSAFHEETIKLAREKADWNQARLFEAWTALRGQSKGLQRQRRLIKRLQAENAQLRAELFAFKAIQQSRGGNSNE